MADSSSGLRGEAPLDRFILILGTVALLLGIAAAALSVTNRALQREVVAGQAKIAAAQTAANVNNSLIRMLAKSAAEDKDDQLRALLARNGISFQATPPTPPTPPAAAE